MNPAILLKGSLVWVTRDELVLKRRTSIETDMQPAGSKNSALNRVTSITSQLAYSTGGKMAYKTRTVGAANTLDYRVYIEDASGKVVSPFHDIPLYANAEKTILNCVIESKWLIVWYWTVGLHMTVPRWTNAKLEVCILSPRLLIV